MTAASGSRMIDSASLSNSLIRPASLAALSASYVFALQPEAVSSTKSDCSTDSIDRYL